tara:strand:+ start:528 stop:683 length:156 start_codon:yes stop_codon:yes gene_type:complete
MKRENLKIKNKGRFNRTMGSLRPSPFASNLRFKTRNAGGFSPFDTIRRRKR